MALSASGNSLMILPTASDFGTPGYIGLPGTLPTNSARIAFRKTLATNPSEVISVSPAADGIEIGGEMDPVEAGDSVLDNMGVLSPFLVFGFYVRGSWPAPVCLQTQQMRIDASHQRRWPLKDLI
jgi:hypothetical protein